MAAPKLTEFRLEMLEDDLAHLIFDMPGRTMNVFSNRAIHEAEAIADWLSGSGLKGLVISSGKATGFCAGADLGELAQAYAMIIAAPEADRWHLARDHFAPIGRAFRKLETAGVPIAVAIDGLALGGGCEFALAAHHRVMTDNPASALGLPESLVGLLPGGGGTQRMPRVVGLEAAMPALLDGARFTPETAVAAGAVHQVVPQGRQIEACLEWLRGAPAPEQPWDGAAWENPEAAAVTAALEGLRAARQQETGGHYPAITSILDCVEQGLPLDMDAAVGRELDIFASLIVRPEPRDMISSLFLGKQIWQKQRKTGALPPAYSAIVSAVRSAWAEAADRLSGETVRSAMHWARFARTEPQDAPPRAPSSAALKDRPGIAPTGIWIDAPDGPDQRAAGVLLGVSVLAALETAPELSADERRAADFQIVTELGFPAYLGGPFALYDSIGSGGVRRLLDFGSAG